MRITNESDYALRIVCALAEAGGVVNASVLSEKTDVTLRFALKILRKLALAGIVNSKMGSGGGYSLAREPESISVGELVEVIEGPIHVSACTEPGYVCPRASDSEKPCGYHLFFCGINEKVKKELYGVTVRDAVSMSSGLAAK